ncbi:MULTISPECIES: adenylyltransferase/cytidyltransferase family protein [Micrococcaceae]|uniref:Glycerol-3-phosphate cytidylyltransferase n=1 Tax=Pseudoglutamicibacter albus TaxID=98671 RepID=A0ABU1YZ61_9MICC|nr:MULTISPECIES: adenylyltransferase/cytidyltransferase family protein [Micrococcaceae]MCG7304851.1 adenylyltransferase/cytidyltransferase family protein [Pseudoglutamicibacter albus]MDR7293654.1 glycerol-3-phosphate cytidylyltransferase [Pseudoglutamicibacter albus]OFT43344.1 glycerol-3-phosphate cytidiltransferase [Arthrobacter sp. HMSC06H05]
MARTIITYGTFDLFHIGHLNILRRLKEQCDRLIVGVSTDEFNQIKGKKPIVPFEQRIEIVRSIRYVDEAIPEENWDQKRSDIEKHNVDAFAIGEDWKGKFDDLEDIVEVIYLPRTDGISTTELKRILSSFDARKVNELKESLDTLSRIVEELG